VTVDINSHQSEIIIDLQYVLLHNVSGIVTVDINSRQSAISTVLQYVLLHNVSGVVTVDINIFTLIQRKNSSRSNMWPGLANQIKNIFVIKITNRVVSKINFLVQINNESSCSAL
jgi:hypothetical protein